MVIKIHCDKCGKELSHSEILYCNEMVGYGHFCREHLPDKNVTYSSPVLLATSTAPFDEKFLECWKKAVENFKLTP